MGISLVQVYSARRPLLGLSEQIVVIPSESNINVKNRGFKVLYVFGGRADIRLEDGIRYLLVPGDVMVLPFPCVQCYLNETSSDQRFHALVLYFDSTVLPHETSSADREFSEWLRNTFKTNLHFGLADCFSVWNLALRARMACESEGLWPQLLACELARQLLLQIAASCGLMQPCPPLPERKAVEEICDKVLAGRATSGQRTNINRLFHRHQGMSYAGFLHHFRVDQAKSMLLNSLEPIGVIARQLKFGSSGAFCRVFRTIAGITPNQYRRGHRASVSFSIKEHEFELSKTAKPKSSSVAPTWEIMERSVSLKATSLVLICVLRGTAEIIINGEKVSLGCHERNALLVQKGVQLGFNPSKGDQKSCIGIVKISETIRQWGGAQTIRNSLAGSKWIEVCYPNTDILAPLRQSLLNPHETLYSRLVLHSLTDLLILVGFDLACGTPPSVAEPDQPLRVSEVLLGRTKEYIHKHYAYPLTLGKIAYAVGVSEEHLARIFRAGMGDTVMNYLFGFRVRMARRHLKDARSTLAEVAQASGFQTTGHFCRWFKNTFHCTPGEYRISVQNSEK